MGGGGRFGCCFREDASDAADILEKNWRKKRAVDLNN